MGLTGRPGNPANRLRERYAQLMTIPCPEALATAALETVDGPGFSAGNRAKFRANLNGAQRRGLAGVQMFLTNFMLAADGLRVI